MFPRRGRGVSPVPVRLFADFTCPFSYLVEAVLWEMEAAGEIALTAHTYELHPAPAPLPEGDEVEVRAAAARDIASTLGLALDAPRHPALRTRKAHELARFAAEHGRGGPLRRVLYEAYFARGEDIGRIDVLARLAAGAGLDETEARVVLDVDRYAEAVARDAALARAAAVRAAPTCLVGPPGEERPIEGAWPPAELRALVLGT